MTIAKNDYIIVKAELSESEFAIVKTGSYANRNMFLNGTLIAVSVGEEVKEVKVGDKLLFGKKKPERYERFAELLGEKELENVEYFIAKEEIVLATL